MLFSSQPVLNVPVKLKLNDAVLISTETHKHLGLVLNSSLTWSDHVNSVCLKVSKRLGILYKFKFSLNRKALIKLYCSWIRLVIEYCSICYDNLSVSDSIKLEKLQRRALLLCVGALPRSETNKLLIEVGIPSLLDRRRNAKLILFYKILHKLTPAYLYNDLNDTCALNSRHITRLCNPKCRLSKYRNSFFPSSVKLWNSLSHEIKSNSASVLAFKNQICKVNVSDKMIIDVYNSFSGFYGRTMTQLRLGLSNLRGDLFSFHLTENPMSPLCLNFFESNIHFFCDCAGLVQQRNFFISKLSTIVPDILSYKARSFVKLCLFGSNEYSSELNSSILKMTVEFIKSSDRFSSKFMNNY